MRIKLKVSQRNSKNMKTKKKIHIAKKTWLCRSCGLMRSGNRYANLKKGWHECQFCTPYLKGEMA